MSAAQLAVLTFSFILLSCASNNFKSYTQAKVPKNFIVEFELSDSFSKDKYWGNIQVHQENSPCKYSDLGRFNLQHNQKNNISLPLNKNLKLTFNRIRKSKNFFATPDEHHMSNSFSIKTKKNKTHKLLYKERGSSTLIKLFQKKTKNDNFLEIEFQTNQNCQ